MIDLDDRWDVWIRSVLISLIAFVFIGFIFGLYCVADLIAKAYGG